MQILERLLGESPGKTFLSKHFTRLPFSSTGGAKEFTNLLTWKTVEDILSAKKSVLRIVQDGKVIRDYVDLNFTEAKKHHEEGHTLLLRFAEKSSKALKEVADDFQKSFH